MLAIIDEMEGIKRPMPPRLAQDRAKHDAGLSSWLGRLLRERYAGRMIGVRGGEVEPGDLIGFRMGKGGPQHAAIVGPERNTLWHCSRPIGVCRTGFGQDAEVVLIGRIMDKRRWNERLT